MFYWWKFIFGYVEVELQALGAERLISSAARLGIQLHALRRISYAVLHAKVSIRDYERLCKLIQGKGEIKVLKRGGLAQALYLCKKRPWLVAGCIAVIVAVLVVSQLCLDIRIEGLETIDEYSVYETVVENGGNRFTFKSAIDLDEIEYALQQKFPKLSYIYAAFDGVSLVVTVDEGIEPPELLQTQPSAVFAKKGGVVEEVLVVEGQAQVQPGDIVKQGDELISGAYIKNETPFVVAGRGIVRAKVDYVSRATVEYNASELVPTGRQARATFLRIGRRMIPIEGENPFEQYLESSHVSATLGVNAPLHLDFIEVTYHEATPQFSEESRQAALIQAREQAYYEALKSIPREAEILSFFSHVEEMEGKLSVTAVISVSEEIGERRAISGEPPVVPGETEE